MSDRKIQQILKKINYLEAEVEIQKQILFSIPSDNTGEIENTLRVIAARKGDIEGLRRQINDLDPKEFARIVAFEQASARFMAIGAENTFTDLFYRQADQECGLRLADGTAIDCLVKGRDAKGGWTALTIDGEVLQFSRDQVVEPAEINSQNQSHPH
ncbi:hypothetical protein JWG42_06900 [Desulfoprunum benzoelyticum]|uniref:Uncharacterized protein n=1 Tax=Desulfoprunum benzoelyticum TaxID=1506996 RepID=A0A840V180_9BACT|nr:hypothetical protein [Desulfoprunum benzoelyticum]MBB5348618.1 hypothetical protein [Desulfoprunum benzoelyticum]MBM9529871.1 hypothetical protein [Desulfoprunum benzoelyticum]